MTGARALLDLVPQVHGRLPFADLAELPTPVAELGDIACALGAGAELYQKCDDRSAAIYGGNKVRTLEVLFGDALARGATHVYATGGYGSNLAVATALHAPRAGLVPGALLFPQPPSESARENLLLLLSRRPAQAIRDLLHWSTLPLGIWQQARESRRRGERAMIFEPGGAVPLAALAYVSAGIELAAQVAAGALPRPRTVVVAAGSNCTSAGLLAGFAIAARLGIGLCERGRPAPPLLVAVRVTPWPLCSSRRIVSLAERASLLLARLSRNDRFECARSELAAQLELDGSQLGAGYGLATAAGREALSLWRAHRDQPLDTSYSGKAAAALIDRLRRGATGPLLYWATKSSVALPAISSAALDAAPARMRRWLQDNPVTRN